MRALETEHRGWRIRVRAHPAGRGWSALVEVWPPDAPAGAEGTVVPFSAMLGSEKLAKIGGRDAAARFIEREAARA
jgi:hypothetical protein